MSTLRAAEPASLPATAPLSPLPLEGAERSVYFRGEWLLFASLVLVSLFPIWTPERYPSQNGPWFLLPTQMFMHYGDVERDYAEYYVRNWHPIPHMLHDALVGVASTIVPVRIAEKLILSVYVFLLPASVFYWLGGVAPSRRELGYLSFLMIHNYPLLRGYHNFTLSIPLFFLTVGYWWRIRDRLRIRDAVILSIGSTLVYLSHLVSFALLAGTIGWLSLFDTRSFGRALRTSFATTWPGWLLALDYLLLNRRSATWVERSDTEWTPVLRNMQFFFERFFHSISPAAYYIAVCVWCWCLILLGIQLFDFRSSVGLTFRKLLMNPFTSLVIFLAVAYLVVPYKIIGWHKANVRLIPFVLVTLLAGIGQFAAQAFTRLRRTLFIVPIGFGVLAMNVLVAREVVTMDRLVAVYLSGIEAVGPRPKLLPIHLENPEFCLVRPLTYAYDHYHLVRGGANGKGIGGLNTLSIMWYQEYPVEERFPKYDDAWLERTDSNPWRKEACRVLNAYDHVLIWGDAGEELLSQLAETDFECIHHRDKLQIFKKRMTNLVRSGRTVSGIE